MKRFPYITDELNDVFAKERTHWDFVYLRPLLTVAYFFFRVLVFPLKFTIHRRPWPGEAYLIDWWMAFGIKYLATQDAAELFIRHVQIEPILYRHILQDTQNPTPHNDQKLNSIDGDFAVEDLDAVKNCGLTIGHDLLSYEVVDRFDRDRFLRQIEEIRNRRPESHESWSKDVLAANRQHSWQVLGPTSVVMMIVTTITIFGSLHTTVTALNSFGSDSLLLWCLKQLYVDDQQVQIDLDFFMQDMPNRGHYHSSVFFSNPYQYLYYHVVFDEVAYDLLRSHPPISPAATSDE